jgi:hypothetical protein
MIVRLAETGLFPRVVSVRVPDHRLSSPKHSFAFHLTREDILTFLCDVVQNWQSETADLPQVEGQQRQ